MNSYTNIDEYILNFEGVAKDFLVRVRQLAAELSRENTTESITYGIPTIRINGRSKLHFAAYPHHVSLYPASDELVKQIPALKPYRSGKGTFKFELNEPLPWELISKIVKYRLTEL